MKNKMSANFMLILTAMIWGFAFVAQKSATIAPFTFNAIRFIALSAKNQCPGVEKTAGPFYAGGTTLLPTALRILPVISVFHVEKISENIILHDMKRQPSAQTEKIENRGFYAAVHT